MPVVLINLGEGANECSVQETSEKRVAKMRKCNEKVLTSVRILASQCAESIHTPSTSIPSDNTTFFVPLSSSATCSSPVIAPSLFLTFTPSSATLHCTCTERAWPTMFGRHFRSTKAVPKVLSFRRNSASACRAACSLVLALDKLVNRLSGTFGARLDSLACLNSHCARLRCEL